MRKVSLLKRLNSKFGFDKEVITFYWLIKKFKHIYNNKLYTCNTVSKTIRKRVIIISIIPFFLLCNIGSAFSVTNQSGIDGNPSLTVRAKSFAVIGSSAMLGAGVGSVTGAVSGLTSGLFSGALGGSRRGWQFGLTLSDFGMNPQQPRGLLRSISRVGISGSSSIVGGVIGAVGGGTNGFVRGIMSGAVVGGSTGISYGSSLGVAMRLKEQASCWGKEEEKKMQSMSTPDKLKLWKQLKDGAEGQAEWWLKDAEKQEEYAKKCDIRAQESAARLTWSQRVPQVAAQPSQQLQGMWSKVSQWWKGQDGASPPQVSAYEKTWSGFVKNREDKAKEYREDAEKSLQQAKLCLEESKVAASKIKALQGGCWFDSIRSAMSWVIGGNKNNSVQPQPQHLPQNGNGGARAPLPGAPQVPPQPVLGGRQVNLQDVQFNLGSNGRIQMVVPGGQPIPPEGQQGQGQQPVVPQGSGGQASGRAALNAAPVPGGAPQGQLGQPVLGGTPQAGPQGQPGQKIQQQQQPPRGGLLRGVYSVTRSLGRYLPFIPGYNAGGQISSLMGMQGILVDASEQVSTTLKMLSLKAHEGRPNTEALLEGKRLTRIMTSQGPFKMSKDDFESVVVGLNTFRPFARIDSYEANLESKVCSGQAGVVTDIMSGVSLGLAYNCHKDEAKEFGGIQLGSGLGSVKAKTEVEGLSAIVAINPEKAGFTGHIASSYGWGKIKNTRTFSHGDGQVSTKGAPDISLTGGLVQVGYNIPVSKNVIVTPYTEVMFSVVTWDPYKEKSGLLPSLISGNTERVMEKNIGIRSQWKMDKNSLVQGWVVGISGSRNTAALSAKPLMAPIDKYKAYVPMNKRQYVRTEFGLLYTTNLTKRLALGINGQARFEKVKKVEGQNVGLQLQYTY